MSLGNARIRESYEKEYPTLFRIACASGLGQDFADDMVQETFDELAALSINELNLLLRTDAVAADKVETVGTASAEAYIGQEKAREIALQRAGVSADSLIQYKIEMDTYRGVMVYDVEFVSGGYEYDCEVDALTGEVLKFEREYEGMIPNVGPMPDNGTSTVSGEITVEDAKSIALNHAGVSANAATFIESKRDYDDGRFVC